MKLSTQFQYEQLVRAIDSCEDIEELKKQLKDLLKLYYSHKEVSENLLFQK